MLLPYFLTSVHMSSLVGMAQVQSFLVAPSDVTVTQGQTAILKCQVAHVKGSLQWTKNGFALGE